MIYTRLISGLGNQLFQYAVARHLSLLQDVPLKLDTSFFRTQSLRSYKLDHYCINATIATDSELKEFMYLAQSKSLFAKLRRKIEGLPTQHKRRYFKERESWIHEPDLYHSGPNTYMDGYWQHYKYFEPIHTASLFNELTLKDQAELNEHPIFDHIRQDASSVSLHIRRGDYVTDQEAYNLLGVMPLEYYYKAIAYLQDKISTPNFYIFSDDLNWAKDNLKIDAPLTFVDIADGTKDYLELDAMSKCRHHIIANSSYSWWGAYLNQQPDKMVIAPRQWVRPPEINKKIEMQLPSWIKL